VIAADVYADFLTDEYLDSYIADGGAAVKFVVATDPGVADQFAGTVLERAAAGGYACVRVDAVQVRAHMMDQVFFDVARQVDWDGVAAHQVRAAYAAADFPAPQGGDISVEAVAAHHDVDPGELNRDVNRQLQRAVFHDYGMVREFRVAMYRLCQSQLRTGQVTDAERDAVLQWLRGELRQISLLRAAMIFRRIGRDNARQLLFSLAHWLSVNGRPGLLLVIDLRRFGFARRPQIAERHGLYYTKANLLDGYEMLRQLVDNTDELSHCCVLVIAAPEFTTDTVRGVDAYQALKLRIHDEIRDRNRDNPFSSLVRVGSR
jgi:hypothetical protein